MLIIFLGINKPFGGKIFVLGGDFRQVLPVIPLGSRSDIVQSCLKNSFRWRHVHVMKLTINMRVQQLSGNLISLSN